MSSMNYTVDSHPVRFPVLHAVLGAGGHVVYEDTTLGTSWGFVEETAAPTLVVGLDMAVPGSEKTVITPMAVVDGVPVVVGASVVVPAPMDTKAVDEAPGVPAGAPTAETPAAPAAKAPKKGTSL